MSKTYLCVICEIGKPPYQAELTDNQMEALVGDSLESASPESLESWGHECPLPRDSIILLGGNARVRDNPPPPNRFGVLGNLVVVGRRGSLRRDRVEQVIEAVNKYDLDQLTKSFRIPRGTVSAPSWEKQGKTWSPEVNLTGDLRQGREIAFINSLLLKYGDQIVACYQQQPWGAMFCLELQFFGSPEGSEQAQSFLREYEGGFDAKGRMTKLASVAVDALLKQKGQA